MNEKDVEDIKAMIRHLHNDIANVRREQEIYERRLFEFVYLFSDYFHVPEKDMEKVISLDPQHYSGLDELYSPIDEVDRISWEEHLRKEREEREIMVIEENERLKRDLTLKKEMASFWDGHRM